jgi:arsenate reductase
MAERFVNELCGDDFEAESAGLEPGTLNPLVKEVMAEVGIDVSDHKPRAVSDVFKEGTVFSYVVTVCDETAAERCPVFPGGTERLHWGFPDPSALQGTWEEKLAATRKIRDQIKGQVEEEFCAGMCR